MKALKHSIVALTALSAFTFSSCDLLDKADDVTLEEQLTVNWNVDENLDGTDVPYNDMQLLKLQDNSVLEPYLNKIKKIEVTKITYHITNFNNDPHGLAVIFNDGIASFGPYDSNSPLVSVPMAGASGVDLQTQTTETTLAIDAAGLTSIAQMLVDDKQVKMYTEGILSKTPVSFTVVSTFYVKVTANAL